MGLSLFANFCILDFVTINTVARNTRQDLHLQKYNSQKQQLLSETRFRIRHVAAICFKFCNTRFLASEKIQSYPYPYPYHVATAKYPWCWCICLHSINCGWKGRQVKFLLSIVVSHSDRKRPFCGYCTFSKYNNF